MIYEKLITVELSSDEVLQIQRALELLGREIGNRQSNEFSFLQNCEVELNLSFRNTNQYDNFLEEFYGNYNSATEKEDEDFSRLQDKFKID